LDARGCAAKFAVMTPSSGRADAAPTLTARSPSPSSSPGEAEPSIVQILLAFAAIYLIWGSTYLAIRFAIETMPPLGMASVRFLIAGTMMYAWARRLGARPPTPRQWRDGAISGTLLLAGGNGAVVVAEQWVPSGLVALLVAAVPIWLVLLDALFGSRRRPSGRALAGILVGFAGVGLLAGSPGVGQGGARELLGATIVMAGSFSWAAGSLYSRQRGSSLRPRMLVASQMLCGGVVLGVLALAAGEASGFSLADVSVRSWMAFVYLIVAGAIIGYGAYIWLLTVVEPARVGTYAYVNPVVAMVLGWAFAGEPVSGRALLAAAVILGSVVVITSEPTGARRGGRAAPTPVPTGDVAAPTGSRGSV
jgi:drug/metabolite transporter (DMT)-like permease